MFRLWFYPRIHPLMIRSHSTWIHHTFPPSIIPPPTRRRRPLQLGVAPLQRRRQLRLCRRRRRGGRVGRSGRRQVWTRRRRALVGRTQGMISIGAGALCFEQVSVLVHNMFTRTVSREGWSVPLLLPFRFHPNPNAYTLPSATLTRYHVTLTTFPPSSRPPSEPSTSQFVGAVNELYALDIACGAAHVCMIVSATGRGAAAEAQLAAFPEVRRFCTSV
jgi:hypothetical protein